MEDKKFERIVKYLEDEWENDMDEMEFDDCIISL